MSKQLNILIRPATADDANFILNSWLRSARHSQSLSQIPKEVYFSQHHKVVERLLKSAKTLVACNPQDPTQIYGFACGEMRESVFVLHYCYIKQIFRKLGAATQLLQELGHSKELAGCTTHYPRNASFFFEKFSLLFVPYLAHEVASERK